MKGPRLHPMVIALPIALAVGCVGTSAQTGIALYNHKPAGNLQFSVVDLNSATKADLVMLPGIDATVAQRIINGRPYRTKTELVDRKVVPASTYVKIEGRVIARVIAPSR